MKEADKAILKKLKEEGRIVNVAVEHHSYPFCWRSDTPLIYKVWLVQHIDAYQRHLPLGA